jgi:hypothetical protein
MNLWVLLFITFTQKTDIGYSFEAGKLPYMLKTEKECKQLSDKIKASVLDTKGEFVCVKITKNNVKI